MIEKNVVILRIETGNPSGVVRYIQMLTEGMKHMNGIKVHIICLNTSLIFPKFEVTEDRIIANIPYPSKSKPLRNEIYWLTKYFNVVSDLISPYFKNRKQLIWHVQELLLVKLADILKLSLGGHILTHLHIIPWKLSLEYNESLFKKQYSQWLNNTFNLINENQLEKIAYPLSDRIICVSYSAMKHIISAYGIHPDKISVIYNGMDEKIDTKEIKEKLTENINNSLNGKISGSEQKAINTFVDTICKEYETTISHTNYEKKINEALNKINKYIDLAKKAMMVIIGVTGVILVLLSIKRIYRITSKIGVAFVIDGLILILGEKYVSSNIKVDTIMLLNNGISDVLQSILNEILGNILKTGSILLALGIVLIIVYAVIKSIRKIKREKDQYTPEN